MAGLKDAPPVHRAADDEDESGQFAVVELGPAYANKIFTEEDAAHPPQFEGDESGQVLVVAGRVVRVARTAKVRVALSSGLLVETRKEPTPPTQIPQMKDLLENGGLQFPRHPDYNK